MPAWESAEESTERRTCPLVDEESAHRRRPQAPATPPFLPAPPAPMRFPASPRSSFGAAAETMTSTATGDNSSESNVEETNTAEQASGATNGSYALRSYEEAIKAAGLENRSKFSSVHRFFSLRS